MVTMLLKLRPQLKPQDFTAQLYAAIVDRPEGGLEAGPRQEVVWGQKSIAMPVTRGQVVSGILVFDRPAGGDSLCGGPFNNGPEQVNVGDTVHLTNIAWPGNVHLTNIAWPGK